MNPSERIKALQLEIQIEQKKISNCRHIWGKVKYDPYTKKEPTFSHYEPHGSDPEPIYNWSDKTVPRWSRTCTECGHTEYTEKTGPAEPQKTEPKF